MGYFESAKLCSAHEYNRHINNRLDLASAQNDDLLVLMILLNGVHEAAKLPARLLEKTTPKGLLHVEVAFVDNNLKTRHIEVFPTQDNFLLVQDKLNVTYDGARSTATECYARDYFESMMPPEFLVSQAKAIDRELVLT
jgi:hypothetical protein